MFSVSPSEWALAVRSANASTTASVATASAVSCISLSFTRELRSQLAVCRSRDGCE